MKKNKKAEINFINLLYTFMVAFVVFSVVSWAVGEFTDKPEIKIGKWLLAFIFCIAAWLAWGVIYNLQFATGRKDARTTVFIVIIVAVVLYLLFTNLEGLLGTVFKVIP